MRPTLWSRRLLLTTIALAAVGVGVAGCEGGAVRGGGRFLSLGTAGTGGIYYPIGGAIASRLSIRDSVRQYTAEVSGGSVENVNLLREEQIDLAFALAITVYEAYHGGQDYAEPFTALRVLGPLYANVIHFLVPRGSTVSGIRDLAGKRVSVGSAGSGTEQVSRQILEAFGLTYDSIDVRYLTFSETSASLRDGAIDGALISVGYPAAAVLEATTTGGARLVPLGENGIARLMERYPYYAVGAIPEGAYPGVADDVATVAMMNWIVGRKSLPGEVVGYLVSVLRDDRASLAQVHEMARQIDLGALGSAPIPLHDAVKEWLESGDGSQRKGIGL